MIEKLESILNEGLEKINNIKDINEVEEVRKELFGKNSMLSEISKNMGSLSPEERKEVGIKSGEIRNTLNSKLDLKNEELINLKVS